MQEFTPEKFRHDRLQERALACAEAQVCLRLRFPFTHFAAIDGFVMSDLAAFQMRRLSRADGQAFRAIRLEGLEKHPSAFSASFKEESGHPPSWFADRLDGNFVLGMEDRGRLVGVAGFYIQGSEKTRHRGTLWGMYVREEARGTGVARRLVDGILAHARQHVEEVALSVWDENPAAIACYKSAGFGVTGLDARALKIGGAYFDHLLMKAQLVG